MDPLEFLAIRFHYGGVADIYVEDIVVLKKEDSDWDLEMDELEEDADDEVEKKILSMPVASEPLMEDNWELWQIRFWFSTKRS